jgi:hypothetical protein
MRLALLFICTNPPKRKVELPVNQRFLAVSCLFAHTSAVHFTSGNAPQILQILRVVGPFDLQSVTQRRHKEKMRKKKMAVHGGAKPGRIRGIMPVYGLF